MNTNTPYTAATAAQPAGAPQSHDARPDSMRPDSMRPDARELSVSAQSAQRAPNVGEMDCPNCGAPMPDLKGGHDTICSVCGYKDSCCY